MGADVETESAFNNQPVLNPSSGRLGNSNQPTSIIDWFRQKNVWDPSVFHATFFLAPTRSFRKLSAREPGGAPLVEKRNSAESPRDLFTTGIWVGFGVNNDLVFRTGIMNLTRGEQSNYTIYRTSDTVINDDLNVYNYVSIPFVLGFHRDFSAFGFMAYSGFSADFLTKVQANIINDNGDDLEFLNRGKIRKSQSSWLIGGEMYLKLSEDLAVTVSPFYSTQLSSVFNSPKSYSHKGTSMGLGFGIRGNF